MKALFYLSVIALSAVFFTLGLFNQVMVKFDYGFGSQEVPLIAIMLGFFFFGALITLFVFGIKVMFWKSKAQALEKQLAREYKIQDKEQVKKSFDKDRKA